MQTKTNLQMLKRAVCCLVLLCAFFQAHAQPKVVGYLPTGFSPSVVDFTRITHLMIAFENPDAAGNFSYASGNDALVNAAHSNNVKVLVSICGGGASQNTTIQSIYTNLMSPANRADFINKIIAYVNAHNLDGIDLDLEGPAINQYYSDFTIELRNAMPTGKLVTAALSHDNGGNNVSSAAIQALDFLGIMAYDQYWGQPLHHSTYEYATTSVNWWITNKGLSPDKAVLGVPFYGYTNTTGQGGISFANILSTYGVAAAQQDTWTARGKTIYYNGIPTIRRKTQYAVDNNLGGIMIWQLAQDATGTNSLLYHINDVFSVTCPPPAQPGTISGSTSVIQGNSQTYSIASVTGATSYTWTLPLGWSGSSTSTSITATAGAQSGTISVSANNSCGTGPSSSLTVTSTAQNLALNRPVVVSSVQAGTSFIGANAVDGSATTKWASALIDPSWVYVDFGSSFNVSRVKITWDAGYAYNYRVETSTDGTNWTTISTVVRNRKLVNDITNLAGTGRYVRVYMTERRNAQLGYSIFELEIYGNPAGGRAANISEEFAEGETFEPYPIPAEDKLFVKGMSSFYGGTIKIISVNGQEHLSQTFDRDELDVSMLPAGFYVLRLAKDLRIATTKLMKK